MAIWIAISRDPSVEPSSAMMISVANAPSWERTEVTVSSSVAAPLKHGMMTDIFGTPVARCDAW